MKRYIKASNDIDAELKPYLDHIDEMIEQGTTLDDIHDYVEELVDSEQIYEGNYLYNTARRRFRQARREKEEAEMTPEELYGLKPHTFSVTAFANEYNEMVSAPSIYSDPGRAIKRWCQLEKKYPMDVMITGYHDDIDTLRSWVTDNVNEFTKWCEQYNVPYKTDYLIEECTKPARPSKIKAPDQIHPFGLG